jgi:predicted ATPase
MRVKSIRLIGIRCFDDTEPIELSPCCNVFVGKNNSGKSTLLKSVLALQGFPFNATDVRSNAALAYSEAQFEGVTSQDSVLKGDVQKMQSFQVQQFISDSARPASQPTVINHPNLRLNINESLFPNVRPKHVFVPFLAKRKAMHYDENVSANPQTPLNGTLQNLYGRIDRLVTSGHPRHEAFQTALRAIVDLPITTKASPNGKQAGMFLTDEEDSFITLDQMGDGISEMVALIVELCLERGKIFVLEEPETNLHPAALKALLKMIRGSSSSNQFIIATHSNIVLRDLGYDDRNKMIRVYRDGDKRLSPSRVEVVARDPATHTSMLRELGYEFADFDLHDAWLFLEESSAEQIFNEVLIPLFFSDLKGRLRTFSAAGISSVEASVDEFQRLIVFVHLQPVYKGRLWIRTDGDDEGKAAAARLRKNFGYLSKNTCDSFYEVAFERYYPKRFGDQVRTVLTVKDKKQRQRDKIALMLEVVAWSKRNADEATTAWRESAREPIELLQAIWRSLKGHSTRNTLDH